MLQQSRRKEWRKRRRRKKISRFLGIILIAGLIIYCIGYGGKRFYGKYITGTLKGATTSDSTKTSDSKDTSEEANDSEVGKNTEITKDNDVSKIPDISDNNDVSKEPNASERPNPPMNPNASEKPDTSKNKNPDKQEDVVNSADGVDESYFDNAVFIGDSRTEGFGLYSGLKKTTFYTAKGLKVDTIFENKSVKLNREKLTIIDALKKQSFGKVYIMLGINELGWVYEDVFINKYVNVLDAIKQSQPQAEIYVQSIIHISKDKDNNSPSYFSNKNINNRNKLIKKMAESQKVHYLDLNEVLSDQSGCLFADASIDGVHLNQQYCMLWKEYLLEHILN